MTQTPEPYYVPQDNVQTFPVDSSEQVRLGKLSMEVSVALTREETLQTMLTSCTDALVQHLGAAFARIWTLNEEDNILELQASSGMYTHLDGAHGRVPVGSLKIGLIAAERKPHLTNEVLGDPRVGDQEWARREGMISFAGYPLLLGDRLIGVMALFARYQLNDAILQAMATIANGIALGIERLHMREERLRLLQQEQVARIEAEQLHQRLQSLFEQAPAGICILRGPQHYIDFANVGYLQIVGQRDLVGKTVREALPEIAGQGFFELLDQVYTTGEPFVGKETKVLLDRQQKGTFEDGYFHFVYQPTRDATDTVDGILLHAVEVTEQVNARKLLQSSQERLQDLNANLEMLVEKRTEVLNQLNTELQRSNQELQDFAYVASHDLQEPLRKIQAFGNLLEEEYGAVLGDGQGYLDRMRNAAGRMRVLIDDLLTFSRVTTKVAPIALVDLNATVRQVLDDLDPRLQATRGSVTVGPLPVIEADSGQMYQLFQNLLTNAVKFHRRDLPPVINIYVEQRIKSAEESLCQIFIEDNGIGFDEKYLDRIFTVFQRLHGKSDYEGTGIGLAVVRKIVERHGGTVTARSTPGQGSTFIMTLPIHSSLKKENPRDE